MRTQDVVEIFGTKKALAVAIGLSENAVYHWGENVPTNRQTSVRLAMRERASQLEQDAAKMRAVSNEV